MQTFLEISTAAAREIAWAQTVVTNNLANVGTTAFKADLYQAESVYAEGGIGSTQAGIQSLGTGVDYTPGNLQYTGNDLDIAINGEGWMTVITPEGSQALSRRGDLRLDVNGLLMDAQGNNILGQSGGPIAIPPNSGLSIGVDGSVSFTPLGEPPTTRVLLDRINLVNPPAEDIAKGLDGYHRVEAIGDLVPDASITLAVGALEASNVNPVAAMVEMIDLARLFESHVRTMKTAEQMDTSATSLMRLEG